MGCDGEDDEVLSSHTHYTHMHHTSDYVMTREIPEQTYNYTEHQDGLVTYDFTE